MLKRYLLLSLLFYFVTTTLFAGIQTEVDRDQLASDEILTLVLSSNDHLHIAPDLSPLKNNFYVMGTSQSSQFKIINGSTQMETQWQIALMPKHAGDILLPAIQVGNEKTTPRLIHVSAAKGSRSVPAASHDQNVFMEVSIVPKEAFIQEQFIYTLKLFYNRTIENPYLEGPDLADAKISQNGQDILYTTSKNGKYYRVLERSYLITPKNIGNFKIVPPILKGYLEQQLRSFDIYGLATNTAQPIKIIGPTVAIKVKPKPATFQGQWLPAKKLTFSESWENRTFREGEPATRIFEVKVEGATGEQIPVLKIDSAPNLNSYPQQVQRETTANGNIPVGKMTQKVVYIPTASGNIHLPPIKIHWWNTLTRKETISSIPSRTVYVLPALTKNTFVPSQTSRAITTSALPPPTPAPSKNHFWQTVAIFFIVIWLLTLFVFKRQIKVSDVLLKLLPKTKKMSLSESQKLLKEACRANSAKQARRYFLAWAMAYWKEARLHALSDIIFLLNDIESNSLKAQIMQLEAMFYGKNKREWDGAAFLNALQEYLKKSEHKNTMPEDPLPPLYPPEASR